MVQTSATAPLTRYADIFVAEIKEQLQLFYRSRYETSTCSHARIKPPPWILENVWNSIPLRPHDHLQRNKHFNFHDRHPINDSVFASHDWTSPILRILWTLSIYLFLPSAIHKDLQIFTRRSYRCLKIFVLLHECRCAKGFGSV